MPTWEDLDSFSLNIDKEDSSSILLQYVICKLHPIFTLKQLGDLDYFLGKEVKRFFNSSIILSQVKYICYLLDKVGMTDPKGVSIRLPGGVKLSKLGSDYMDDPTLYRSIIGALQYDYYKA